MSNVMINNEIGITFADSFSEMSEQELTRYFGSPADRWGAYDAERHIILSVGWKKAGFLQSDPEMHLFELQSRLRRSLLNFQQITTYKTKIASAKKDNASGVRFEYRVKDSVRVHVVDLIVFKHKKNFYAVYFVSRKANAAAVRTDLQQILQSVTLN
ncbi:MAG: hypothetical protein IJH07_01630 [Ruminococcus sp.]|nr:hypothetical protein [Ruminococcus sp.]